MVEFQSNRSCNYLVEILRTFGYNINFIIKKFIWKTKLQPRTGKKSLNFSVVLILHSYTIGIKLKCVYAHTPLL